VPFLFATLVQVLIADRYCRNPSFASAVAQLVDLRALYPEPTPRGAGVDRLGLVVISLQALELALRLQGVLVGPDTSVSGEWWYYGHSLPPDRKPLSVSMYDWADQIR
jgi:hypothetical protein